MFGLQRVKSSEMVRQTNLRLLFCVSMHRQSVLHDVTPSLAFDVGGIALSYSQVQISVSSSAPPP